MSGGGIVDCGSRAARCQATRQKTTALKLVLILPLAATYIKYVDGGNRVQFDGRRCGVGYFNGDLVRTGLRVVSDLDAKRLVCGEIAKVEY